MGAIRAVVNSFDQSGDLAEAQKQVITLLSELADSKAQLFEAELRDSLLNAGTKGNQSIPITAIISSTTETHAYTQESVKSIPETVGKSLKSFMSGSKDNIITGVGSLISEAVTIFLGDTTASTGRLKKYYIMTEGLSVVRVDLSGWYLSIEAKSIKSKVDKVSAFVAIKSSVDINQIDYNTFLNVYQIQLSKSGIDSKEINQALEEARNIYSQFKELSRPTSPANLNLEL